MWGDEDSEIRDFGWGRFTTPLGDGKLRMGPATGVGIERVRLSPHHLRVSEAIAPHQAGLD